MRQALKFPGCVGRLTVRGMLLAPVWRPIPAKGQAEEIAAEAFDDVRVFTSEFFGVPWGDGVGLNFAAFEGEGDGAARALSHLPPPPPPPCCAGGRACATSRPGVMRAWERPSWGEQDNSRWPSSFHRAWAPLVESPLRFCGGRRGGGGWGLQRLEGGVLDSPAGSPPRLAVPPPPFVTPPCVPTPREISLDPL